MRIYYSPAFTGNAYYRLDNADVAFDVQVCGNSELLHLLMLHLGISDRMVSPSERQTAYYDAFNSVDIIQPDNIFHESLSIGQMTVTNECLRWRDYLILAQWNKDMNQPTPRLDFLSKVEENFNSLGEADYWLKVLDALKTKNPFSAGSEFFITFLKRDLLPPYIQNVIRELESNGLKINACDFSQLSSDSNLAIIQRYLAGDDSLKIGTPDDTFHILQFKDEYAALQYVASKSADSYDVYINSDNKNFDDLQLMLKQPTSGSNIMNANPQIVQLFKVGVSLFSYPFNIYNVLSWLQMQHSPITSKFKSEGKPRIGLRRLLASAVVNSGGIFNKDWEDAIKAFLDSAEDDDELNYLKKNVSALDILLPIQHSDNIEKKELLKFIGQMKKWIIGQTQLQGVTDVEIDQYQKTAEMYGMLEIFVKKEGDVIKYDKLEKWMNAIYDDATYKYTEPQRNSRFIISNPGDMVTSADNVLWMDFYNYTSSPTTYDFLNPFEKASLKDCSFYDDVAETTLSNCLYLIPFMACRKKLTLLTVERKDAAKTTKHPLLIRLAKHFGNDFSSLIETGTFPTKEENKINNEVNEKELHINNKDKIVFRDSESYSSLNNLIQYPFDYAMQYIAKINTGSSTQLPNLNLIKGTTAHKVIQDFCSKDDKSVEAILRDVELNYDDELNNAIQECGAALWLQENLTEYRLFRLQLQEAILNLLDIIEKYKLTIDSCEEPINKDLGLYENVLVDGRMDMILHTSDNVPVIFDFKWSTSDYYSKLQENKAMQLAIYAALVVANENKGSNVISAYYQMPRNSLYTTSDIFINQHNVVVIHPQESIDIMPLVVNSYRYRREQLEQGIIETGELLLLTDLDYYNNQDDKHLYPLDKKSANIKADNSYSNYKPFKPLRNG